MKEDEDGCELNSYKCFSDCIGLERSLRMIQPEKVEETINNEYFFSNELRPNNITLFLCNKRKDESLTPSVSSLDLINNFQTFGRILLIL